MRLIHLPAVAAVALAVHACQLGAAEPNAAGDHDSAAASAAARVADTDPQCRAIGDFYWEIGNAQGVLASGRVGDAYGPNEMVDIASASKLVWGAYVLEKLGDRQPSAEQLSFLEMKSGYARFNPLFCLMSNSVASCMEARSNDRRESGAIGRFSYGGGHSQRMAVEMGLGRYSAEELTAEVMGTLGLRDAQIKYKRPQPAGGLQATPAAYGRFLRKILSGELRMKRFLGYKPVCGYTGAGCDAVSSPVPERWHYSLNHWIEDDPQNGDGAYSSPGLTGFYPWISADKSIYGLLAREKLSRSAYWESVQCGRRIRGAWMQAQ